MRFNCTLAAAAVAAIASAGTAFGDIAVTNENNPDGGTVSFIIGDIRRATSFFTAAAGGTIDSVSMRVYNRDGVGSSFTFTCAIYADAGGAPGALVGSFGNVTNNQAVPAFQGISFSTPGINVNALTTYWLVMGAAAGSSSAGADWLGTQLPYDTSTLGWSIGNNSMGYLPGPGWVNSGSPHRFTVNIAVPTPGAAALLGIGGLVAGRRRR